MKEIVKAFLLKIGISTLTAMAFKLLFFRLNDFLDTDLFLIPVIVLLLWEGNIFINNRLEKKYKWVEDSKKRMITQVTVSLLFTMTTLFICIDLLHFIKFHEFKPINRAIRQLFVPAIFITLFVLVSYVSRQFFKAWKQSLVEVEKYKTESANAQLQNLKNQLNPHFLFNNLSVLSSLVYQNQDKAVDFINELSKVYRYVLDNKNAELVSLEDELSFLDHYIYLLKIRFGNSILFEINIDKNAKNRFLPPMCLQMLVENTIQHNETSQANPLEVCIYTENNHLIITNPIQPRSDKVESSQIGLKNMKVRYQFFTDEKIEISNSELIFKVTLPLIAKK